jgi:hypothetical protein
MRSEFEITLVPGTTRLYKLKAPQILADGTSRRCTWVNDVNSIAWCPMNGYEDVIVALKKYVNGLLLAMW